LSGSCLFLTLNNNGDEEKEVFEELCPIVEETIGLYRKDNRPLPKETRLEVGDRNEDETN
jgi:hypothetical protein